MMRAALALHKPHAGHAGEPDRSANQVRSAAKFSDMVIDQFDAMLEQSRVAPLVMGIALHSMIAGQPFRVRQLRRAFAHLARQREAVWTTTAGEIARHFASG